MASGIPEPQPGPSVGPVVGVVYDPPPDVAPVYQEPPFVNTPVPSANALAAVHNEQVSNTLSLIAPKVGDPVPWVIGRTMAKGWVVAGHDGSGELVIDVLWSQGEVEEYEHRIFAGIREGLGTALGENEHFTGTPGQLASPIMASLFGSYDALPNMAHSVLTLNPNFQPKTLDIRMLMKGMKFYDPRPSPQATAYTTTPALVGAGIMQACGYVFNDEGWASVAEVADYNEELVGSPGIQRWEISGQIWNREQLSVWMQAMSAYGHFFIDVQGDTVYFVKDAPRSSNHSVSGDTAFVSGSERKHRPGGRNVPDSVITLFETLIEDGDNVSLVPTSYTYGSPGGAGTITQLRMPLVPDVARAGRHAEEAYNKAQNDFEFHFDSFDEGLQRAVGDLGALTNPHFALSSQTMYLLKNRLVAPGRWRREYHAYDAGNYSDALHTGTTNYNPLGNPNDPPDGPVPSLTEELAVNPSGLTYARIKINFTGVSWAYIQHYRVVVTGDDATVVLESEPVANQGAGVVHQLYTAEPLVSGVEYTVSVYVRSVTDVLGSPGEDTITITTAPNAQLDVGDPINMHVYILDGDAKYATSCEKIGSPAAGNSWADLFDASPQSDSGNTWMEDIAFLTVFETEVWDSGQAWDGLWRMSLLNITPLNGATTAPNVSVSEDVSPISFTDYPGASHSTPGRFMKAEAQVADSPITAGLGLHVKLPVHVDFTLGG